MVWFVKQVGYPHWPAEEPWTVKDRREASKKGRNAVSALNTKFDDNVMFDIWRRLTSILLWRGASEAFMTELVAKSGPPEEYWKKFAALDSSPDDS